MHPSFGTSVRQARPCLQTIALIVATNRGHARRRAGHREPVERREENRAQDRTALSARRSAISPFDGTAARSARRRRKSLRPANERRVDPSIDDGRHPLRASYHQFRKLHLPGLAELAGRSRVRCRTRRVGEPPCMTCLTVGSSKMDKRYLRMLREKILGRVAGFARCKGP